MNRGKRPAPIGELKRRLPSDFLDELTRAFPALTVDRILRGMGARRRTTLRVNTLKSNTSEVIRFFREQAVKFQRVLWYRDGFILDEARKRDAQSWEIYRNGSIYLQSLSSMIPPLVLAPVPGERILDIAAAPGSKTTQMAALMGNRGFILANELNAIRSEKLIYTIKLLGASIAQVLTGPGERIGARCPQSFDRALIDVPCSGEGRFSIDSVASYRTWSRKEVTRCARLQKKLFESGFHALKRGGTLVYSTCTLNSEENEMLVQWALENFDIEVLPIEIAIQAALPGFTGKMDRQLRRAIRILPSAEMEGFFVCKMRRKG